MSPWLAVTLRRTAGGVSRRRAGASLPAAQAPPPDDVRTMVGRLELENYKATLKGLTQFGDRREGTQRNRDAVDWIEAQLKSYGCTNTERIDLRAAGRAWWRRRRRRTAPRVRPGQPDRQGSAAAAAGAAPVQAAGRPAAGRGRAARRRTGVRPGQPAPAGQRGRWRRWRPRARPSARWPSPCATAQAARRSTAIAGGRA